MQRRTRSHRLSAGGRRGGRSRRAGVLAPHRRRRRPMSPTPSPRCRAPAPRPRSPARLVTVEGIVTADHRGGGYRGIFVQTAGPAARRMPRPAPPTASSSSSRSNPAAGVAIGDKVKVTGTRRRVQLRQTQITATAAGSSSSSQAGAGVPTRDAAARHRRRQRRARPSRACWSPRPATTSVVSSHNLQNFGELWPSAGAALPVEAPRPQAPAPPAATAIATANTTPACSLDDGYSIRVDNAAHPATSRTSPRTPWCATATS